jgi:hypothetical protein
VKQDVRFEIYVEGGLVDTVSSSQAAERLRRQFEGEGWTVKVVKVQETVFGPMGIEVY